MTVKVLLYNDLPLRLMRSETYCVSAYFTQYRAGERHGSWTSAKVRLEIDTGRFDQAEGLQSQLDLEQVNRQ